MGSRQRKTSRRQFISGEAALQAVEDSLPAEQPAWESTPATVRAQNYLLQVGRSAMACDFDVFLNAGQHPGATEAAVEALDLVDQLESQLTVYRSTSEVVEINRTAGTKSVAVESQLFGLLQRALEIHRISGGAFDITGGPLSKAWGFFRREGRFPTAEQIRAALERVGSQSVELDASNQTVRFLQPELEINFNAIGKGYALDRAAALMVQRGLTDFLIHGGQSSILGRGSRQESDANARGWLVSLRHPLQPDRRLAEIRLIDRAIGTSGSGNQFFYFEGRRYGHIIDPRSGYPAQQVLSATVLAPDAASADAMATAFFVLGVEESLAICSTLPELDAIFVLPGRRTGEVEVVSTGFNDDTLRLLDN